MFFPSRWRLVSGRCFWPGTASGLTPPSRQAKWKSCKRLKKKGLERMKRLAKLGTLLLFPVPLIGCAKTEVVATVDRPALCADWQHQTISKNDKLTDQTASQIEANNKSRPAWGCAYGKNEAEPSKG